MNEPEDCPLDRTPLILAIGGGTSLVFGCVLLISSMLIVVMALVPATKELKEATELQHKVNQETKEVADSLESARKDAIKLRKESKDVQGEVNVHLANMISRLDVLEKRAKKLEE